MRIDAGMTILNLSAASGFTRTTVEPQQQDTDAAPDTTVGPKRGRPGWRALRAYRLSDFRKLWAIRGGFRKGCRNIAVFYYGLLLAQTGTSLKNAKLEARILNQACLPPLKLTEVDKAVKSSYSRVESKSSSGHKSKSSRKYEKVCDQTIADWLDITPDEASSLRCEATATRFSSKADMPASKPKRIEKDTARMTGRHAAIIQIISEANGHVPSSRKMAAALKAQGFAVGHVTVTKDYAYLDLKMATSSKTNKAVCQSNCLLLSASADLDK